MKKVVKNRMLSNDVMNARVGVAFEKYVKRFLSDWKKKESFRPECYGDDTSDDESGDQFVQNQIEFIGRYLGFLLLAGPHMENLNRIRAFLDMQRGVKDKDSIEICFMNGQPYEGYVYVYSLNDIDLADAYSITHYDTLLIKREDNQKWTKPLIKQMVEEVRSDLEYDGDKVPLSYHLFKDTLVIECDFSNY